MFEHGGKLWGVEICMDHVRGALRTVETGVQELSNTSETLYDIHVVLSASCPHYWENVCVKKGGLFIHCDSHHEDDTRFGCWQRNLDGEFSPLEIVEDNSRWRIFKAPGHKLIL